MTTDVIYTGDHEHSDSLLLDAEFWRLVQRARLDSDDDNLSERASVALRDNPALVSATVATERWSDGTPVYDNMTDEYGDPDDFYGGEE